MLDSDLARLYGVTTAALNQAVRRNADRFPGDFAYPLTRQEVADLISQIVISKPGPGDPSMSQFATPKPSRGGRRKLPWAFSEHGVAMLSSVLRSPTAVRVNIEIMRTFVRLRRLMATPGELVERPVGRGTEEGVARSGACFFWFLSLHEQRKKPARGAGNRN